LASGNFREVEYLKIEMGVCHAIPLLLEEANLP